MFFEIKVETGPIQTNLFISIIFYFIVSKCMCAKKAEM
jgi:hypothetical protein